MVNFRASQGAQDPVLRVIKAKVLQDFIPQVPEIVTFMQKQYGYDTATATTVLHNKVSDVLAAMSTPLLDEKNRQEKQIDKLKVELAYVKEGCDTDKDKLRNALKSCKHDSAESEKHLRTMAGVNLMHTRNLFALMREFKIPIPSGTVAREAWPVFKTKVADLLRERREHMTLITQHDELKDKLKAKAEQLDAVRGQEADLNEAVTRLTEELVAAREDLSRHENDAKLREADLERRLGEYRETIARLTQNIADDVTRITELNASLKEKNLQINTLETNLNKQKRRISGLVRDNNTRKTEVRTLTDRNAEGEVQIDRLRAIVDDKESKVQQLSETVRDRQSEIDRLTAVVNGQRGDIERLTDQVANHQAEITRLVDSVAEKQAIIDSAANVDRLLDSVDNRDLIGINFGGDEMNRLSASVAEQNTIIAQLTLQVEQSETRIRQLAESVADKEATIRRLSDQLEASVIEHSVGTETQAQLYTLTQSIAEKQSTIDRLVAEKDAIILELQREKTDRSTTTRDHEARINELNDQLAASQSILQRVAELDDNTRRSLAEYNTIKDLYDRVSASLQKAQTHFRAVNYNEPVTNIILDVLERVKNDSMDFSSVEIPSVQRHETGKRQAPHSHTESGHGEAIGTVSNGVQQVVLVDHHVGRLFPQTPEAGTSIPATAGAVSRVYSDISEVSDDENRNADASLTLSRNTGKWLSMAHLESTEEPQVPESRGLSRDTGKWLSMVHLGSAEEPIEPQVPQSRGLGVSSKGVRLNDDGGAPWSGDDSDSSDEKQLKRGTEVTKTTHSSGSKKPVCRKKARQTATSQNELPDTDDGNKKDTRDSTKVQRSLTGGLKRGYDPDWKLPKLKRKKSAKPPTEFRETFDIEVFRKELGASSAPQSALVDRDENSRTDRPQFCLGDEFLLPVTTGPDQSPAADTLSPQLRTTFEGSDDSNQDPFGQVKRRGYTTPEFNAFLEGLTKDLG